MDPKGRRPGKGTRGEAEGCSEKGQEENTRY